MDDQSFRNEHDYIPSTEAAQRAGFTNDYISRLCRQGRLVARKEGTQWYVSARSLGQFLAENKEMRKKRREQLSQERKLDGFSGESVTVV